MMKAWKRQSIAVVYSVIMLLPVVWGEAFFLKRDHSDLQEYVREETYKVRSVEEAEVQLEKYGYIKGCHVRRNRRNLPGGLFNVVELEDKKDDCSAEKVHASLIAYQKRFGLPQTGKFDIETQRLMNTKRCGNKDEGKLPIKNDIQSTATPSTTDSTQTTQKTKSKSRTARSVNSFRPKEAPSEPKSRTGSLLSKLFPKTRQNPLSRRRRALEEFKDVLRTGKESINVINRPEDLAKIRSKRSAIVNANEQGSVFGKEVVTWRLLSNAESKKMPRNDQLGVLGLAFRMWSEVIPLHFALDEHGHIKDVDIEIGFYEKRHPNCDHIFDGMGGEMAHSWVTGDIHFDQEEDYKADDADGVQLLKIAVHEIGHVLSLSHELSRNYSIMFPYYHSEGTDFELGWEDRKEVQKIYGVCEGKFDTVFDWVRKMPDLTTVYNSYFFRDGKYWMYENSANRTRYGDPLSITSNWKGIPAKVDGYAHVYIRNFFDHRTISDQYFFSGEYYYLYDAKSDDTDNSRPRKIADDFKAKPGQTERIPDNIDTVFFDHRDQNFYFFKGAWVYVYNPFGDGCCERKKKIVDEFPALTVNDTLPNDLDAVYFSYKDLSVFFIKGNDLWQNTLYDFSGSMANGIKKLNKWSDKWFDICEVE